MKKQKSIVDFFFAKTSGDRRASKAVIIAAVALVVVIICNLLIAKLSTSVTEIDISGNGLYKVSDTAKDYIKSLDQDVELILVASDDQIDNRILKYVNNYAAQSRHLSVSQVDPYENTSILETYDCTSGSLVVNCEATEKFTSIPFSGSSDALILTSINASTGTASAAYFDAEGQITSALDYVTGDTTGLIYTLSGHNESDFPVNAADAVTKSNISIADKPINLLSTEGGIPEDCDLLICYNPSTDLADDELSILKDYMQSGGNLMLFIDSYDLENFNALAAEYGMEIQNGYVGDEENFFYNYVNYYGYYCIYPVLSEDSAITEDIDSMAFLLYPVGMKETAPARDTITVSPFMTTSDKGLSYIDEENYVQGETYTLGASATEIIDSEKGISSNLTVITAVSLIDDQITSAYPNMANLDIFMNAVTQNFDNVSNISIPAKSLSVTYNTITNHLPLSLLFIAVIPIAFLIYGIAYSIKRKKA